ncbi:MAG: hypothetical protein PHW52_01525 [Candidatus Pacebacteria bacterium]|nr:hypothetical protein [Candidatus Paceibacterota bacterium]
MHELKVEVVKDDDGAVIGFDLSALPSDEAECFVRSLPRNLYLGMASISFTEKEMIITNEPEGPCSFDLPPKEISVLKEYLDTLGKGTVAEKIQLKGFNHTAQFRFRNEGIRQR